MASSSSLDDPVVADVAVRWLIDLAVAVVVHAVAAGLEHLIGVGSKLMDQSPADAMV